MGQGLSYTQLSSTTRLSRHLAHLLCESKLAIIWPHDPLRCPFLSPGEARVLNIQHYDKYFHQTEV